MLSTRLRPHRASKFWSHACSLLPDDRMAWALSNMARMKLPGIKVLFTVASQNVEYTKGEGEFRSRADRHTRAGGSGLPTGGIELTLQYRGLTLDVCAEQS
jgi:hypothetical protein